MVVVIVIMVMVIPKSNIMITNLWHIETATKRTPFRRRYLKCIFLNENVWIPIEISLKFVPKGPIDNIPA